MAETMMCVVSTNPGPEEERVAIRDIVTASETDTKEGDTFYLITHRWWQSWLAYVNQEHQVITSNESLTDAGNDITSSSEVRRPSSIDNSDLILDSAIEDSTSEFELRDSLVEGRDYILLPHGVWNQFYLWYGGGPVVARKVINSGLSQTELSVEVYPLHLHLLVMPRGDLSTVRISKKETIGELHRRACEIFDLNPAQVWIWDYYGHTKHALMNDMSKTLDNANIQTDQEILLEVRSNGAGGVSAGKGMSRNGSSEQSQSQFLISSASDVENSYGISGVITRGTSAGLSGLQNLGNTCFMNSALQCLVHTPPIVEYFLQDYTQDINTKNPLGMHGELALAFGDLLRKLWSSGRNAVAPRVFKGKLGRFAPQFSGYNQHDSQELLAFLLDGLHEDLNRVKQKPYIEAKDYDGHPDKEVAEECWKNHKARNDSVIVDICQGQYKSTLVCPDCGKISITFDPFMYLSLPLPSMLTRTMTVTVFYGNGSGLPMPYTVTVAKAGCLRDLIQALTSACCLSGDERLLLAEVYGHKIYQYLENPLTPLSNIKNEDRIVAYRLPKLPGLKRLEIIHQCHGKYVSDTIRSGERKLLGSPLVTYIEEDCLSGEVIDRCVCKVLLPLKRSTYMTRPRCNNENANSPAEIVPGTDSFGSHSINQSITDGKDDEMSNCDLTFHVCLVDSGGKILGPLTADCNVRPSQSIKVLLDWTEKEHEMYDVSYIEHIPEVKAAVVVKKTKQEAISLSSCLEAFLKEEPLGPDDMWYCPGCKEHRQATKKLDLWRLPDILVFHLKRFSYNRYMKNKLDAFVNFPIHNLDLGKYISDVSNQHANVYELYAISNHYGGLGGGHYTAMAKLIKEDRWYHFDDSHVSPINEEDIKTSAAYVLFYRRVKV